MKIRDKYGWPVEIRKGRHIHNFFRYLFVGNLRQTWRRRHER